MAGVTLSFDGPVAVVTFDRAEKMNALSTEMVVALRDRLAQAEAREDISAL